jgi:hypothetical protein
VPDSGGTTTVVLLFCGAGGLLLLIHPDSALSTTSEANKIFIEAPFPVFLPGTDFMRDQLAAFGRCIEFVPPRYRTSVRSYGRVVGGLRA